MQWALCVTFQQRRSDFKRVTRIGLAPCFIYTIIASFFLHLMYKGRPELLLKEQGLLWVGRGGGEKKENVDEPAYLAQPVRPHGLLQQLNVPQGICLDEGY